LRKSGFKSLAALDLALDVPHHPAKIGLERSQAPVRPLELFGMDVTLLLDQRELTHPRIGLAQGNAVFPGTPDEPFPITPRRSSVRAASSYPYYGLD